MKSCWWTWRQRASEQFLGGKNWNLFFEFEFWRNPDFLLRIVNSSSFLRIDETTEIKITSNVKNLEELLSAHWRTIVFTMTRFRPCIDIHAGSVKQIVGGTLTKSSSDLKTNYISSQPSSFYAKLYRDADCRGAHIIMLGPGNEAAAKEAIQAWPGKLQIGGGITDTNAGEWIENGAEKVCVV